MDQELPVDPASIDPSMSSARERDAEPGSVRGTGWNEQSVDWITANAAAILDDQQRRSESLQTRAAQVAGFAGATVALSGPLAHRALKDFSGTLEALAAVCYFGGTVALAAAIVVSVVWVLRPVSHLALGAAEVGHYVEDPRFRMQSPAEIQIRTLKALRKGVERYERVNRTKAACLKISAGLFLLGLLLTVGVGITIGVDRLCD